MNLSLIGMSGSGKSYWSARLVEHGFKCFCCDDLIEEKLAPDLIKPDGTTMEVGEWMGFPYELRYKEREAKYLAYEVEVLAKIFTALKAPGENRVVDTTGSVIYTGEEVVNKLRQYTLVVHLSTPAEIREQMLGRYVANQRPVLWNGLFNQQPHETGEEALARCYPALLSSRERLYEQYADVTIDYYTRSKAGFGVEEFLRIIKAKNNRAVI